MQGVVLAAGRGTRLHPISLARSKGTVPVCGRTMVERVIRSLARAGIRDHVVVSAPGDERLYGILAGLDGGDVGRVRWVEQAEPKGMGHALMCARPLVSEAFCLSACDSLVPGVFVAELVGQHVERANQATLALRVMASRDESRRTGVIAGSPDRITGIVEKPEPEAAPSMYGSLPLYVFEPLLLEYLDAIEPSPRGEYELQDAIRLVIERHGKVSGLLTNARQHVTSVADLLALNRQLLDMGEGRVPDHAAVEQPVHVSAQAALGEFCRIGPYAVLEGACTIGAGATVRNAVVLDGAVVPDRAKIDNEVVVPPNGGAST